jgi:septum formation protein
MKSLILASGSPSRKEILENTGFPFSVDVSNYEEDMGVNLPPKDLAVFLSKGKAHDVARRHSNAIILAADSFGVFNGQLLGKPHTTQRAKEMLSMLSGQAHTFITGFSIVDSDTGKEYSEAVETEVYFKELSPQEIDDYLTKDNVLEKAGAYAIQGFGRSLVERIEGDDNNVRGLPIINVADVLKDFGINLIPKQ